MTGRCVDCGDVRRLDEDGRCEWRAGCQHRVLQRRVREHRVLAETARVVDEAGARIRRELRHPSNRAPRIPDWIGEYMRGIMARPVGPLHIWLERPDDPDDPDQHAWLAWPDQTGPQKAYWDGTLWSYGGEDLW